MNSGARKYNRGPVATTRRAAACLAVLLAVLGPVFGSGPARAATGSDRLLPGEVLLAGESISAGHDTLTMQADGNLVLYAPGRIPLWASDTAGHGGAQLVMQADPGRKMAAEGSDWLTNPQTQIRWGEDYIQSRYGTPCQAWAYWQARRYYGPLLAVVLGAD
jgi:hypothetical protein